MNRINALLERSTPKKVEVPETVTQASTKIGKQFTKFMVENHMPRYLLMGICVIKLVSIYDKTRTIVAIN